MSQLSRASHALRRPMATFVVVFALLASTLSGVAFADGTEALGPPSVPLAEGSGFAIGGVGLEDVQPASFDVEVPVGASVEQVLLYWEGFDRRAADGGDATITVNGIPVTGMQIGGTTRFFDRAFSTAFRADITGLGLVSDGVSTLTIADVGFTTVNNGAGVLVIYDDGSEADLQLVDGNDLAFINFAAPLDTTVAQTFDFDAVPYDRTVDLSMFATSVNSDSGAFRPNVVEVTIDGATTVFDTPFTSNVGKEWDAVTLVVTVPAGATSMTIQALSLDLEPNRGLPASFGWIGLAAAIPLPAEIGDFVWFDADGDGLQDADEAGVPDVLVTLTDCDGVALDSRMTGADGLYLFTELEPGCYQVVFDAPDGLGFTVQDAGDDAIDSDADPATGASPQVVLVSGESNRTIDAGLVEPGIDIEKLTNGNDADDPNGADVPQIAPGDAVTWTYQVTNVGSVPFAAADIEVVDDTIGPITDIVDQGDGDDVLSPGEVWIYQATAPDGAQDLTDPTPGTTIVNGCNPDGTTVPGDRATYANIGTVTVPGADASDPSHYCNPPEPDIELDKTVYAGHDGGTTCPGVELVSGFNGDPVTYCFEITNIGDTFLDVTEVTDPDLGVTVPVEASLAPGDVVTVFLEATIDGDLINTAEVCGNPTDDLGNDLAGLDDVCDDDPAEVEELPPGSIGDFVWLDTDGDGTQDPDEPGVDGATVTLLDCNGNVLDTTTTGPDGSYLFTGLPAGCYQVSFELPNGLVFTTPDQGDDTLDSDADPTDGTSPQFGLGVGEDNLTIDAGAVPLGSIGDFVWLDTDGDGTQDPDEPGVDGATVTLLDCNGNVLDTTTTGPDGSYLFTGLPAGCYQVSFELPNGLVFTTPDQGDDTLDSDADPTDGTSRQFGLGVGEDNLTIDAGAVELRPAIALEKFTLVVQGQTGGDLCEAFDKPAQLTMLYTGDGPDATSSSQDSGKVVVTGDPDDASPVYIVASKDEDGEGDIWFQGTVSLGEQFVIDAGTDKLGSSTHVTIYASEGGPVLQRIEFHTSCSQPLLLGDQFGAIQLIEFVDDNGDGDTLPPPSGDFGEDADTPTGPTANAGATIQWTYVVTNPGDLQLADVVVTDDAGTPDDAADDFTATALVEAGVNAGDADGDGLLDPGEEWLFRATGIARLGQYANLGTVVAQPVLGGQPTGDAVSDTDPSHYLGIFGEDLCEAFDKPAQLTMLYTGDGPDATSSSQDSGKVVVTGDPDDASPVYIVASKDEDGDGDIWFQGTVSLGEQFVIDAGTDKLGSSTHVTIYASEGGPVLQRIEFHTSCSQPLLLGDQFGAIRLVDFVDDNGDGPGTVPLTGVAVDKVELKSKELKIKLENLGDADIVLERVEISWPVATNRGLKEIKNGGDTIFEPSSPRRVSPLVIAAGDWSGDADDRVLEGDDTSEFKFTFEADVDRDLSAYTVTFRFSDGSMVDVGG